MATRIPPDLPTPSVSLIVSGAGVLNVGMGDYTDLFWQETITLNGADVTLDGEYVSSLPTDPITLDDEQITLDGDVVWTDLYERYDYVRDVLRGGCVLYTGRSETALIELSSRFGAQPTLYFVRARDALGRTSDVTSFTNSGGPYNAELEAAEQATLDLLNQVLTAGVKEEGDVRITEADTHRFVTTVSKNGSVLSEDPTVTMTIRKRRGKNAVYESKPEDVKWSRGTAFITADTSKLVPGIYHYTIDALDGGVKKVVSEGRLIVRDTIGR